FVFVVMGEELRFVGCDVYVCWALRFARFACETEVKRFLNFLVPPALVDYLPLKHFEEHVGSTARAVLFLERCHIAGAHRTAVALAARSQPDASFGGLQERAAVFYEVEMSLGL